MDPLPAAAAGMASFDVVEYQIILPDGQFALATRPATAEERQARERALRPQLGASLSRSEPRPWSILYPWEARLLIPLSVVVWLVVFIGGRREWEHNVPRNCDSRCEDRCDDDTCNYCKEGFINGGLGCFDDVSQLPPVSTAAALGGTTYFVMIITAQVLGAACQLGLMWRLRQRRLLSKRENIILVIALFIEVTRMLTVDVFMLRDYFSGREYQARCVRNLRWQGFAHARCACTTGVQSSDKRNGGGLRRQRLGLATLLHRRRWWLPIH